MLWELRKAVDESGLKFKYLSQKVGVGASTMSRWVSEERAIPDEAIKMICYLLGKKPSQLFPSKRMK